MSRNEDILRAIIYGGSAGERAAESRNEAILLAMLDVLNGEEVDLSHLPAPQSRFESLLLQVVRKLEEGGSGGGGGDPEPVVISRYIQPHKLTGTLSINPGLEEIAEDQLAGFVLVTGIEIPDSVKIIGARGLSAIGSGNGGVKFDFIANSLEHTVSEQREEYHTVDGSVMGGSNIERLVLPSIKTLGDNAFTGCTGLQYIYLGPNCTAIGRYAFGGCPITCKVECGFAEGAVEGFPANSGFAGNPASLDVTYNVPSPTV